MELQASPCSARTAIPNAPPPTTQDGSPCLPPGSGHLKGRLAVYPPGGPPAGAKGPTSPVSLAPRGDHRGVHPRPVTEFVRFLGRELEAGPPRGTFSRMSSQPTVAHFRATGTRTTRTSSAMVHGRCCLSCWRTKTKGQSLMGTAVWAQPATAVFVVGLNKPLKQMTFRVRRVFPARMTPNVRGGHGLPTTMPGCTPPPTEL